MANKKSQPFPDADEERELEDKVKQMLDPSIPDDDKSESEIKVIKDEPEDASADTTELPTKIEIKEPAEESVKTAPELGKKIKVTHFDEPVDETETADSNAKNEPDELTKEAPEPEPVEPEDESAAKTDDKPEDSEVASLEEPAPEPEAEKQDDQPTEEPNDNELDKAVDDIVAKESDRLLEEDDKKLSEVRQAKKPSFGARIKGFFIAWWRNKTARRLTALLLIAAIAVAAIYPTTRYMALNSVGVRSSASVSIIDKSTLQPLKNVSVTINGQAATTDSEGNATVEHIKLGATTLRIEKRAFAPIERKLTIGWGSNPLGGQELEPVGTQYSFLITDYASGKPLHKVEAIKDDASAFSDEEGLLKLTLDMPEDKFEVELIKEGMRTEKIQIDADDMSTRQIKMVAAKKHAYISKRTGKYDVYSVYADGKDEQLVLAGTGSERDDMTLVSHPTRQIAALVSTRNNQRNKDGFLLSDLTIIDLEKPDELVEVTQSERIQIIGWSEERLVYVQIAAGTSAANPERHRLKTYNLDEGSDAEVASSNYFNDVMIAKDLILYAPSSAYAKTPPALFRINPDGSDKQIIHAGEVWSLFRTGHNTVAFTTGRDWYSFAIDDKYTEQLEGEPVSLKSRAYIDNPARTLSLWVDQRDGKGTLLLTTIENGEAEVVHEQSGLKLPVQWLNDTMVVFRVSTDSETADYVVSADGGEPKKLVDVTDTAGLDRWYYY